MNTIGEGVPIAAIIGGERLFKAGGAGHGICEDPGSDRIVQTVDDDEIIR